MKTITLSNRDQKSYRVSGRASLLTELMDQGVDLPYGCKYGGCITCAAKLVEGSVDQRAQVALNNRQIKNGYVILCVARAISERRSGGAGRSASTTTKCDDSISKCKSA